MYDEQPELFHASATAYVATGHKTSTGTVPKRNRTVAFSPRLYGKTIAIWIDKGNGIEPENYVGLFTVEDTGSEPVRSGRVVDVFYGNDLQGAIQFGRRKIIYQVIDGKG